jgi:hypothetical protein
MQRTPRILPVSIQGYARGVVARLGCSEMNTTARAFMCALALREWEDVGAFLRATGASLINGDYK